MSSSPHRSSLFAAVTLAGIAVVATTALPAAAHHAFSAEFDARQTLELKGVVTKVKWVNPHSWLYFDVVDAAGTVTNWGVEFGTPNGLEKLGLTKADVAPGTPVQISGYKARNGGPVGYTLKVTFADGRTFQTGTPQDAAAQRTTANVE
jgi:Family of unknown function (DUF6152)